MWLWGGTLEFKQSGSQAKNDTARIYSTGIMTST